MPERKIDPKFNIHESYRKVNIVNPYRFGGGTSPTGYEPETIAYMNAIDIPDDNGISIYGIPNTQVWISVDTFVKSLKTAGVFFKLKAVYPYIGGTAFTHKFNLINPEDTDSAHRMIWNGSIIHDEFGILGDGGYGNTNFIESQHSELDNESFGFYSRTNVSANYIDMGVVDGSINSRINGWWSNNSTYWRLQSGNYNEEKNQPDSLGFYCASKKGSSVGDGYNQRNDQIDALSITTIGLCSYPFYICAYNNNGSAASFSYRNYSYNFIGEGLNPTESLAHYNAVQQLQTDLGRNV